jgi:hypothetical protein
MKKIFLFIVLFLQIGASYGQKKSYTFEFKAGLQHVGGFEVNGLADMRHFAGFLIEQDNQFFTVIDNRVYHADKLYGYTAILKEPYYPLIPSQNNNYFYILDSKPAVIRLSKVNFTDAALSGANCSLTCEQDAFKRLDISHYNFDHPGHPVYLNWVTADNIQVGSSKLTASILAEGSKTHILNLYDDTVSTTFGFYGMDLPGRINLNRLRFKDDGVLDLATFSYVEGQTCILAVNQTDLSKVKLDYALFNLDKNGLGIPQAEAIYKQLLANQEKSGYKDGYQKADIEFRKMENLKQGHYGKFLNWLQENWNNYGYNKEKIFINALWIFVIFFVLNIGWYRLLIDNGYTITELQAACQNLKSKSWPAKAVLYPFYGLFYTGILFWGLKLDFDKLKMKNGFMAVWILVQYISGLIVLAYIANIVIGK